MGMSRQTVIRGAAEAAQLKRVNDQLEHFYGPLCAFLAASKSALLAMREEVDLEEVRSDKDSTSAVAFRKWLRIVLMPLNMKVWDVISHNHHLISDTNDGQMPACLTQFLAHVAAYQVIIDEWNNDDYRRIRSSVPYPDGIDAYVLQEYGKIKEEQKQLLRLSRL